MKYFLAISLCVVLGIFKWGIAKFQPTVPTTQTLSKKIYLEDIDPQWPLNASPQLPIILVNQQPLYKTSLEGLFTQGSSLTLPPLSLLKEAIKSEIIRQYLLSDQSLSDHEKNSLSPSSRDALNWLPELNHSIKKVLNRKVLDSRQATDFELDPTLNEQEKDKVTIDVLVLSIKRHTKQEIEWLLLENKLLEIKKQLDRRKLSFKEALRLYGISKTTVQARIRELKSYVEGEKRLPKSILDRIFSMSIGEISEPIRFDNGIALIKVIEIVNAKRKHNYRKTVVMMKKVSAEIIKMKRQIIEKLWTYTHLEIPREAVSNQSTPTQSSFIQLILSTDS